MLNIPTTLTSVKTTCDNAISIQLHTPDNLTPETIAELFKLKGGEFWTTLSELQVKPEDIVIPEISFIKDKDEKSPSKRLHDRMFVYYKEKFKKDTGFDYWYISELDRIGCAYLEKLQ